MPYYPVPKYVSKRGARREAEYTFSDNDKRADHSANHATCLRCAQNIAVLSKLCERPENRRCGHCSQGNRAGCTLVPDDLNGCVNRLYALRTRYDAAVAAVPRGPGRKTDPVIQRRGLKLASAQRAFNLSLYNRRRVAAHTGTPMGVSTQVPTTSPHFLGLILAEQRSIARDQNRIANALESIVPLLELVVAARPLPSVDPSDDDSEDGPLDDLGGGGDSGGDGGDGGDNDGDNGGGGDGGGEPGGEGGGE